MYRLIKTSRIWLSLLSLSTITISLVAGAQSAPNLNIQPTQFQGAQYFTTLLGYAMYAAWILVAGAIIFAVFEVARGAGISDGFKRMLMGAIIGAFILTFGWAILSGAL